MTRFALMLAAPIALAASACATMAEPPADNSATIAAAVAAPDRPAEARALDDSRKPVQVLEWLGVKPGMDVADLISGTGYWAEIMAHIVGPKGHVTAYEPNQFYNDEKGDALWSALEQRAPQVSMVRYPFEHFAAPANTIDAAIINLNYHDLYWTSEKYKIAKTDPRKWVRAMYAALKPGGVIGVIDHVGPAGDTREVVDKLHRIDPAVVKADFESAGFKLVSTSDLLANPADDHTKLVFDQSIRGKTDRFMFKFQKPR